MKGERLMRQKQDMDHIPATYTLREIWWANEQGEEILLWQN